MPIRGWPIVMLASAIVVLYGLGLFAVVRFLVFNPELVAVIGGFLGAVGVLVVENIVIISLMVCVRTILEQLWIFRGSNNTMDPL